MDSLDSSSSFGWHVAFFCASLPSCFGGYIINNIRHSASVFFISYTSRLFFNMASSGSGYDLSSSTFSPDGRIFQVEYACKAVENGGTALGIRCRDGVVLCVEKPLLNKMLYPGSTRRIHTVDTYCGLVITGFVSDGRQIVNRARDEASNYQET